MGLWGVMEGVRWGRAGQDGEATARVMATARGQGRGRGRGGENARRANVVECVGYDGIGREHDGSGDDVEMNAPGRDEGPGGHPEPPDEPAIDRPNL